MELNGDPIFWVNFQFNFQSLVLCPNRIMSLVILYTNKTNIKCCFYRQRRATKNQVQFIIILWSTVALIYHCSVDLSILIGDIDHLVCLIVLKVKARSTDDFTLSDFKHS